MCYSMTIGNRCSDSQKAPILAQQRVVYERLQSESAQLDSQLADALAERDSSVSTATDVSRHLKKTNRENESLQKQLNDLRRQVQALLKEISRLQGPTIPSDEELEADESTVPVENIDEDITNNLVLFRSVPKLQAQNCLVSFARWAPRWKRRNASIARRSRKNRVSLSAKRMKPLRHCKNNWKHSAMPTVLKSKRSLRSATLGSTSAA